MLPMSTTLSSTRTRQVVFPCFCIKVQRYLSLFTAPEFTSRVWRVYRPQALLLH
jgi:hypothetical protein